MNRRGFLKFLPVSAAVVAVPAAATNTPGTPEQISCYNNPPKTFAMNTEGVMSVGGGRNTPVMALHVNSNKFETACFEQRHDGNYSLVFKRVA